MNKKSASYVVLHLPPKSALGTKSHSSRQHSSYASEYQDGHLQMLLQAVSLYQHLTAHNVIIRRWKQRDSRCVQVDVTQYYLCK